MRSMITDPSNSRACSNRAVATHILKANQMVLVLMNYFVPYFSNQSIIVFLFVCLFVCFCFFNADMHWGKSSRIPGKTRIQLAKKWSNFNHLLCLAKHYLLHGVHRVFTRLSSVCGGGDDFNSNKYFNPMTIIFFGMNLDSSSSVFTALCKVNDLQKKKPHKKIEKNKTGSNNNKTAPSQLQRPIYGMHLYAVLTDKPFIFYEI